MKEISLHMTHKELETLNCSPEFSKNILDDARALQKRGLPVIFTLPHLAFLSDTKYSTLHAFVTRKVIPYSSFFIKKRTGGKRRIDTPHFSMQCIQSFIKDAILDTNFIHNLTSQSVFSYRKNISIVDHALHHKGAKWLIKIDLKDFFGTIHEPMVYSLFQSFGYAPLLSFEFARLLTIPNPALFTKFNKYSVYAYQNIGVLPQGATTSPQLSNIIFKPVDVELENLAESFETTYSRYADDLYFSAYTLSLDNAKKLLYEAVKIINKNKYTVNLKKTRIFSPKSKKIVTGIVIENGNVYLPKKFKEELKRDIFCAEKFGFKSQSDFLRFRSITHFIENLYGRILFAKQVEASFGKKYAKKFQMLCDKNHFSVAKLAFNIGLRAQSRYWRECSSSQDEQDEQDIDIF